MAEREILIFGSEDIVASSPSANTLSARSVGAETIKANMTSALAVVEGMSDAAQDALANVRMAHMDIQLAVGIDGSVGLLGSGVSSSVTGTITIRIEPRATPAG